MNVNTKPIISIVIPTRERSETLLYAIRTALDQASTNFEIIVSDNFSQDDTEAVVKSFTDSRVRYFNTGRRLSMCDNWEFALERTQGDYTIFIGDDDAIMPGGIDRLEAVIRMRPSLVYCWPTPVYSWPMDGREPRMISSPRIDKTHEINLNRLARLTILSGGAIYPKLPGLYHSAVARSIADKIRQETRRVFHSTQPDVFTCLAVPVFCAKAIRLGFCVTVHGVSQKSNGGAQVSTKNARNIDRFIREYGDYGVHPSLFPGGPAAGNLLVDAILVAKEKFPEFYGKMRFNYSAMWAFMRQSERYFGYRCGVSEILRKRKKIRRSHPFSVSVFLLFCALLDLLSWRRRFLRRKMPAPAPLHIPGNISELVNDLARLQAS